MKKRSWLVLLSLLALVQCGGIDSEGPGEAIAEEETDGGITETSIKGVAISGAGGDVAVDAGFAGNGSTIDIPAGFTAAQCKFTAAAANVEGSALSTRVSINSSTGAVVCEKVVQEREEVPPETKDCVASYTVLCVK